MRKRMGHTAGTLQILQNGAKEKYCNFATFNNVCFMIKCIILSDYEVWIIVRKNCSRSAYEGHLLSLESGRLNMIV